MYLFGAVPFQIVIFIRASGFENKPTCVQRLFDNWAEQTRAGKEGKMRKVNSHGAPECCARCAHQDLLENNYWADVNMP